MKFHLKMSVLLRKDFDVEAESLNDARAIAEQQLLEEVDFNSLEVDRIGLDMDDPTIDEYNRQYCEKRVKEYKAKQQKP